MAGSISASAKMTDFVDPQEEIPVDSERDSSSLASDAPQPELLSLDGEEVELPVCSVTG